MEDDVIYEASATVEGKESGVVEFVQNRSEKSAEAAKRGLKSEARTIHYDKFDPEEKIELRDVRVDKFDPDSL